MARYLITDREYTALVKAYRDRPGDTDYAAEKAKVSKHLARKGWLEGWPRYQRKAIHALLGWTAEPPIRPLGIPETAHYVPPVKEPTPGAPPVVTSAAPMSFGQALVTVEGAMKGVDPSQILNARLTQALQILEDEAKATEVHRKNAYGMAAMTTHLLKASFQLAPKLAQKILELSTKDFTEKEMMLAFSLLERVQAFISRAESIQTAVMRMERLRLGAPETVIGVVEAGDAEPHSSRDAQGPPSVDPLEILAEVKALARTVDAPEQGAVDALLAKAKRAGRSHVQEIVAEDKAVG